MKYRGGIQRVGNFRQIVRPDSQNNLVFFKILKKQKIIEFSGSKTQSLSMQKSRWFHGDNAKVEGLAQVSTDPSWSMPFKKYFGDCKYFADDLDKYFTEAMTKALQMF